ncbi:uncharacterized protein LOC135385314 [Ornithodoros turicata]|uniref:uncharacterized protein LOC135385314 n=1 Tax=Ornithodoros turicata TaxID=34597 RepID=UPI0031386BBA
MQTGRGTSQSLRRKSIKHLSLAYEELSSVHYDLIEKHTQDVQVLDVSHNHIRDVKFLSHFEVLDTVILDHNLLNCLTVFPLLPSLRCLWINFNRVLSPTPFVPSLARSCPNLRHLSLMGNEAAPSYLNGRSQQDNTNYRLYVIANFPLLTFLDDAPVSAEERRQASAIKQHIDAMVHLNQASLTRNSLRAIQPEAIHPSAHSN